MEGMLPEPSRPKTMMTGETVANSTLADAVSWLAGCASLPADVEAKARLLLLDTLGCLLAGLRHPEVQEFGRALRLAFPGDLAWPGSEIRLGPAGAADWDAEATAASFLVLTRILSSRFARRLGRIFF